MLEKMVRAAALVLLPSALLFGAGCGAAGPKTAPVTGKVIYKGQPVPSGTVSFIPASGTAATGEIDADGSFRLTTFRDGDGAILGLHKVVIVAMQDMSKKLPEERVPLPPPIVPDRYTSLATTDLSADVKEGPNAFTFDLQDPKKKK
jgi:hypothetical protein